ncbi:MAG: hypothetical protein DI598_17915 [Pseudopedobacter saltans]|uniref:Uncharacterized protein n=1 Tax=Pseudopedobacter saltans TaxID=151895 RepID=A0A2W5GEH4_9SPHI|nr:MAG: hypothetical protein DI598_17915 [Pseudopedobacter saltans]
MDARNYINPDGTRVQYKNVLPSSELNNPFWDVNKNKSFDKTSNITGNVNLQANIANGLSATVIFGINHYSTLGTMVYHPYSSEAYSLGGYISTYENDFNGINGTARVNYVKKIGKTLSTIFGGIYLEDNSSVTNSQRGERFYEPDFISINNTDPTSQSALLTQTKIRKERGYVGYTFNYNSSLYISLSGTREGVSTMTSKYYDDQPFFNYGSVSGSYILSDMPFMQEAKSWMNFAKLRASYATTGKGVIRPYKIDPAFGAVQTTGGGYSLGVTLSNPNLVPELSKSLELGGEFQFLDNRVSVDVAHFNTKVSKNIIAQRISYGTGGILRYANGGELSSSGWEIQAKVNPIKTKDLYWNIIINFDKARTKITKLPGDLPYYYDSDTWVFGSVRSQVGVGQSLGNLSGFNFERNKNGDLLISPTTGLPTVNQTDYVAIGDRQPDYKVGIVNDFNYKGFGLTFNLDIRKGGDVFNANQEMMMINGISKRTLDRDQPRVIKGVLRDGLENSSNPTPNNIAINPYYRSNYYNGVISESDYIENVNWLRMRDITLSYAISSKTLAKQKFFKAATFYVTATDVFLITNYSGIDPNVNVLTASNAAGYGGAGIDYGAIPNPRAFNFGMRLSF